MLAIREGNFSDFVSIVQDSIRFVIMREREYVSQFVIHKRKVTEKVNEPAERFQSSFSRLTLAGLPSFH